MSNQKIYIDTFTGRKGPYNKWWYRDKNGKRVNAVDEGQVDELFICESVGGLHGITKDTQD